ncbi:MAG: MFS transporter [Anaerovoracaceae bacterium]|jgi:sugar phosphate permease
MKKPQDPMIKTDRLHPVQLKVFFTMVTLYTFYFACNYNLGPATKHIQDEFQLSNGQFGILFTIFTLGFGLGQFAAGFLGDRYNPKLLMYCGAIGATVANICFGFSHSMTSFSIFWGINAVSLSMGWSPGCSILFRWIPRKRWGLFMGFFDAFAFLGGIIAYPIAGFAITYLSWRAAFIVPPALLFIWSFVFFGVVKSSPGEKGLSVEWAAEDEEKSPVTLGDYWKILRSPIMNLICLVAICSQFVRWGLVNWIIKILTEDQSAGGFGMKLVIAAAIASAMHWGGAFFSIGMGYVSDRVFHGSRWQTIAIGYVISALSLAVVFFAGAPLMEMRGGITILTTLLFLSGGCIQGVQAPIFNLPGDILGPKLGGTGVGVVNGWSYIGASFAGGSLGLVMDYFGLTNGLLLMAGISLLGAILIYLVRR